MISDRRVLTIAAVNVAAALAILVLVGQVSAQPSLGFPKGRPYYGSSNQRASRSIGHARDYAQDIYRYSRDADQVTPAVAKEESEELGRNIAKAQQELATAKKEAGNIAETLAALKSIEQHLAVAAKHHQMLHEECCKSSVDGTVCMDCCNKILLELDKAQAEQDALIRSMEMDAKPKAADGHHAQLDPMNATAMPGLAKLSRADRASAEQQRKCPVSDEMLGEMGPPLKVDVNGQYVWICCQNCINELLAHPEKYLAKLHEAGSRE